jgi:hypothetical protein
MAAIKARDVRIPLQVREAVARHEDVVVLSRGRPAYVIIHPEDHAQARLPARGRSLRAALSLLAQVAPPDPDFAEDMTAVRAAVSSAPRSDR